VAIRLVIGNWKMHLGRAEAVTLAVGVATGLEQVPEWQAEQVEVGLAPPYPFLEAVGEALVAHRLPIVLCAQDCHPEKQGAFTGAVSAHMLHSVGVKRVIVGHSERRALFGDTDALVRRKVEAVLGEKMSPVVCVGETLEQREAKRERQVVEAQVRAALEGLPAAAWGDVIVAYEPVWAIGTGKTATPEQAGAMHRFIREVLSGFHANAARVPVIYGGSVKPALIDGLARTPGIEGSLVGGASLEAASFVQIVKGTALATPAGSV
jgi:triosephosphate isomerase (TIM)